VDDEIALEAQEQVLAVGIDALDRPPAQPFRPSVGPEAGCGVSSSSGTRPARIGRIRPAA
jgi:hypothetical protein